MTNIQKARAAVFAYFLLCGSAVTILAAHIPRLEKDLELSPSLIGTLFLLLGAGALASMQLIGNLIDRHGSAITLKLASVALGFSLLLPGIASNYFLLAGAIFILGTSIGAIDIAMNAHALEVEKAYGRPIFSAFHAMWSIGGVLGSAIAAFALSLGSPMSITLTVWGAMTVIVGAAISRALLPSRVSAERSKVAADKSKSKGREFAFVIFIGLVSAAAAVIEGVGIDWSALYSVDKFNVSVATAGISIAVFSGAMAIVRLLADKVVAKFGRIFVIRYGALLSAVGIAIALTMPSVELSWLGWIVAGAGVAAVVPQCMAYGSDIGDEANQGRNLAKVVGLTYAGVLGGPAVIGFLAEVVGLQRGLIFGIALALFVVIGSIFLSRGKQKYGKAI
jgi:MFS family permease